MTVARPEDTLRDSVKGKLCARCETVPWVAWLPMGETTERVGLPKYGYRLRCNCYPQEPVLIDAPKDRLKERYGEVAMTQLAPQLREGINLQPREIKQFLAPKATDQEVTLFLKVCLDSEWNPFVGDAFLIPFFDAKTRQTKHVIVVGLQGYLKRAVRNAAWGGYQSGVVVKEASGSIVHRQGSIEYDGDLLIGAWATVHRKGAVPLTHVIPLKPYDKSEQPNQHLWRTLKAQMIEKVAISQGVRRAFPELDRAYPGIEIRVDEGVDEEGYRPPEAPALNQGIAPPIQGDTHLNQGSAPTNEVDVQDTKEGPQEATGDGADPAETPQATLPATRALGPGGKHYPGRGERETESAYFLRVARESCGLGIGEAYAALGGAPSPTGRWTWTAWEQAGHTLQEALDKLPKEA